MKQRLLGLVFGSLFVTTVQAAGGSLNPVLDDKFTFKAGASWLKADGTFSSTVDGEPTDSLSTSDLDVDDPDASPAFSFRWRFTDRWRLTFDYLGIDTDGSIQQNFDDLEFGDITASGFLAVDTKFKTDFYIAQVGYSFLKNERSELGIGAGVHVVDFDTKLKVSGGITGIGSGSIQSDSVELTAPLPNILGFGTYAFTPKLFLEGSGGWFGLDYNDYSGNLWVLTANLEYRVTDHVGVGVGYNYFDMDLTIDKSSRKDKYDLKYKGPLVYVSAGF
jgi:opacity protein-like surface antigen